MSKKLILASNSPRRSELLNRANLPFEKVVSDYEEIATINDPISTAKGFAFGKAKSVFSALKNSEEYIVLGADTIVVLDDQILGKPTDFAHAKSMLKSLSNRWHYVITAYAILGQDIEIVDCEKTKVLFNDLSDCVIDEYIEKGLPFGKAGAYGIQDGYPLVKEYDGSYDNVVGLPTEKIVPIIKNLIKK